MHFAIPVASVEFEGELQEGSREIRGTFTDHGVTQPLILAYTPSDAPPPPFKAPVAAAGWKVPPADAIRTRS